MVRMGRKVKIREETGVIPDVGHKIGPHILIMHSIINDSNY